MKAVVIRIDSPGGSALASDLMWHQLMKLRKKKPLVFSVGDMAASGGYYLACSGDYIFAEPMSIVGSIGVVGGKIGIGDALERIGVHSETFRRIPHKPGAAARAAYESPLVKWDEPTRARVLESMTSVYELLPRASSRAEHAWARDLTRDKVAESAEGRIFGGEEGKAAGSSTRSAASRAAIAKARELANLSASRTGSRRCRQVRTVRGARSRRRRGTRAREHGVLRSACSSRIAPDVVPFVTGLAPLAEGERTVVCLAVCFDGEVSVAEHERYRSNGKAASTLRRRRLALPSASRGARPASDADASEGHGRRGGAALARVKKKKKKKRACTCARRSG